MKTLQDLLQLQAIAMEKYNKNSGMGMGEVFFSYAGHVNSFDVTYYPLGWDRKDEATEHKYTTYLTEEGIQSAYWWMRVNLRLTNENNY